eukprot:4286726-Amphidinium_carterae.1
MYHTWLDESSLVLSWHPRPGLEFHYYKFLLDESSLDATQDLLEGVCYWMDKDDLDDLLRRSALQEDEKAVPQLKVHQGEMQKNEEQLWQQLNN